MEEINDRSSKAFSWAIVMTAGGNNDLRCLEPLFNSSKISKLGRTALGFFDVTEDIIEDVV